MAVHCSWEVSCYTILLGTLFVVWIRKQHGTLLPTLPCCIHGYWGFTFCPQISLGDYLKRPKKPPEQRKPPPLPPPPSDPPSASSSYMSFLQTSHSAAISSAAAAASTIYTSVSPTTAGTPLSSTMTPSASGSGGLQFEPVSPGEDDGTPPLVTMEGK